MSNATPKYVATCNLITEFVRAHGIKLIPQAQTIDGQPGNKGWACFQIQGTGHKVYVPRSAQAVGALHTTVDVPDGTPGKVPHVNRDGKDLRPGKIESFFSADHATIEHLLRLWAGTSLRLRDARPPTRRDAPLHASEPASEPAVPTAAELTQGA